MGGETRGSENILLVGAVPDSSRVEAGLLTPSVLEVSHEGARRGIEIGILRNMFVVVFVCQV